MVFVIISLIFILYALYMFHTRRRRIAAKQKGPYDDPYGPAGLVILLLIGLITSASLYFVQYGKLCLGTIYLEDEFYRYNPSDLVWHPQLNRLLTVGPDMLTFIDVVSGKTANYEVAGDFEGICVVPSRPDYLYLGREYPPTIEEYSLKEQKVGGDR